VNMNNIYFFALTLGQDFDLNPTGLTASSLQATLPGTSVLTDFFVGGSDAFATAVDLHMNTVGATKSAFAGWSWAEISGAFTEFN
jgi:hypothetical protein